jgi:hypothetical protein
VTMTWFGDLTFPGSAELAMRPYILGLLRASGAGERFRMQKFCLCIGCRKVSHAEILLVHWLYLRCCCAPGSDLQTLCPRFLSCTPASYTACQGGRQSLRAPPPEMLAGGAVAALQTVMFRTSQTTTNHPPTPKTRGVSTVSTPKARGRDPRQS